MSSRCSPRLPAAGLAGRARVTGPIAILAVLLAFVAALGAASPTAAHADLERAEPPPDGLLGAPPEALDLWLTEPVDVGPGSPSIRLFDDAGEAVGTGEPRVDPADGRHVTVPVEGLGSGTYTVGWSVRSATDGHTLSGTYAFRVGGGRAPGAARVQGETPEAWGVATRWLTFLGIALVVGGCFYARVVLRGTEGTADTAGARSGRFDAMVGGSAVALAATVAEPLLQIVQPPAGVADLSFHDSFAAMPEAWWLRLAAVVLLPVALALTRPVSPQWRFGVAAEWATLGLGLLALLGLSLTSHAAARETWREAALASNVLHQWAIALWVGGLAHLALAWPARRAAPVSAAGEVAPAPVSGGAGEGVDAVRRFSRLALGLVVVGVGTGVLNAGLVLPQLAALWESTYGKVLIVKVLVLTPTLALAALHRNALRRGARALGTTLLAGRTVRLEAALAVLVVLGGSVLTLLAPPGTRAGAGDLAMLDLAAPLAEGTVHLQVQPAEPGENAVVVRLDEEAAAGEAPAVRVAFTPLDHDGEARTVEPQPDASGGYAVGGVDLEGEGWWRAEVTVARPGEPETTTPFYLVLPDPNVNGVEAGPAPESEDEARAVFERGLGRMTSLHRLRFTQRLTDGKGALFLAEIAVSDGSDGRPPAWQERASGFERTIIGDREWVRRPGGQWTERAASSLSLPSQWGEAYATARGFRLGPEVELDGRRARIVTFMTPEREEPRRQVAAWFAWWVDVETGHVLREAMVSNRHYMIYGFGAFDAPLTIAPPAPEPRATPPVDDGT